MNLGGAFLYRTDDIDAFLKLLPEKKDGVSLRHVLEVRHVEPHAAGPPAST